MTNQNSISRTEQEILDKIEEFDKKFFFGFHREILVPLLSWKNSKQFLKDDIFMPEKEYNKSRKEKLETTYQEKSAETYVDFAWKKIIDHRGISTIRSIIKFETWLWLLKKDHLINFDNYAPYGAPIIYEICKIMNWPIPEENTKTAYNGFIGPMFEGNPCCNSCENCVS